ncbi:MAG TPA: arsenate reductase (glutaredoxin) [Gammaproteobacteria bacterium]|nr:arsenate reductase (glutaredoxin) [Gammaproteobacteria bacterium]
MKARIYHNPRCSKSRAALALLEARGVEPQIVQYLREPPSAGTLRQLLHKLDVPARDIVRTGEDEFKQLSFDLDGASDEEIVGFLAEHPRLLQRPIVELGDAARVGRPPERVLELFE